MTFLIAMQAEDSVIISADNMLLISDVGQGIYDRGMHADKIHYWDGGVLTGTGEYCVIYRMLKYLRNGLDILLLPSLLEKEKEFRRQEVGGCDQIDITQLIVSASTEYGPRLYIVSSQSVEQVTPGELLIFFPLDYDFFSVSSSAICSLNTSINAKESFSTPAEWVNFYVARFAEIYLLQHMGNEQISKSFHIYFQANDFARTFFIPNVLHC
ncbi:hypothetical protein J9978_21330 [Chromobacterium violaceum]|uniref:hypothetical protein n=1 Tax=Chromobacterium violaceum TaxID=536 RepID=UPI001B341A3E|nr:hypothetical protein [Chromobacterium violaceum]MBP4052023.1 hypothetical protein [Chromobacterium violaceum]